MRVDFSARDHSQRPRDTFVVADCDPDVHFHEELQYPRQHLFSFRKPVSESNQPLSGCLALVTASTLLKSFSPGASCTQPDIEPVIISSVERALLNRRRAKTTLLNLCNQLIRNNLLKSSMAPGSNSGRRARCARSSLLSKC